MNGRRIGIRGGDSTGAARQYAVSAGNRGGMMMLILWTGGKLDSFSRESSRATWGSEDDPLEKAWRAERRSRVAF
jgi:hypothetical protein